MVNTLAAGETVKALDLTETPLPTPDTAFGVTTKPLKRPLAQRALRNSILCRNERVWYYQGTDLSCFLIDFFECLKSGFSPFYLKSFSFTDMRVHLFLAPILENLLTWPPDCH